MYVSLFFQLFDQLADENRLLADYIHHLNIKRELLVLKYFQKKYENIMLKKKYDNSKNQLSNFEHAKW